MRIVVSYDIPDDTRRLKMAALLKSYGERVQLSVFEAELNPYQLKNMLGKVRELMEPEDSVRVYLLGKDWKKRTLTLGRATPLSFPEDDVI